MKTYARVFDGAVVELLSTSVNIAEMFHPDLVWVDVTSVSPAPQQGWVASESGGTWSFAAPVAPAPTLAQQAQSLLNVGCQITSTGTSSLNGTYPADVASQQHIQAEITSILLNGTFADGSTSIEWQDVSGASHAFTVAQFKAFASAFASFVSGCLKVVNGQSSTLPAQPVTIA